MSVPQRIQHDAWIPFHIDPDTGPVNPMAPTGVPAGQGRMWRRGERKCVDIAVTCTTPDGQRWILLVDPDDGRGWSLPGGGLNDGESVRHAATREGQEETGLYVAPHLWQVGKPRYVDDWRADDGAWPVTVLCFYDRGAVDVLPPVHGGDDAAEAAWVRAGCYIEVTDDLATRFGAVECRAHRPLIAEALQPPLPAAA